MVFNPPSIKISLTHISFFSSQFRNINICFYFFSSGFSDLEFTCKLAFLKPCYILESPEERKKKKKKTLMSRTSEHNPSDSGLIRGWGLGIVIL